MEDSVRWSLKVSRETDRALRDHLGQAGARKNELSKFVQEAVQAKLRSTKSSVRGAAQKARVRANAELVDAFREVRSRTRGLSQARLDKLVAEAVAYARARR